MDTGKQASSVTFDRPKAIWPPGPWHEEPDRVDWESHGLPCLILRNNMGALCGYAAVSPGHPLHGKHYDEDGVRLEAHGGLTFSGECHGPICHVPKPGASDDVWWFGFDCAHCGDVMPSMEALRLRVDGGERFGLYRTVEYVRAQVERLAEQLALAGAA